MKPDFRIRRGTLKGAPVWWLVQTAGREVIPNPIAFGQAAEHAEGYAAFISDGYGCTVTIQKAD